MTECQKFDGLGIIYENTDPWFTSNVGHKRDYRLLARVFILLRLGSYLYYSGAYAERRRGIA